jgi:hypothetical protein
MKIYILNVHPLLQPKSQPFAYPTHNHDYGVEQDFLIWLKKKNNLLIQNIETTAWLYLPVFWTRWYLNHNFAVDGAGMKEMTAKAYMGRNNIFTICQYDGSPNVLSDRLISFLAVRT